MPRYVSLKYDKINARNGPDEAHRLLWVYRARGLPVQVVAETAERFSVTLTAAVHNLVPVGASAVFVSPGGRRLGSHHHRPSGRQ